VNGVPELVTPMMQDITLYSRDAMYTPMMAALAKGSAPSIEFQKKGTIANTFKEGIPMDLDVPDNGMVLKGISDLVEVIYLGDGKSCSWGLHWKTPPEGSGFKLGQFPQYVENGVAVPAVPKETTLPDKKFKRPDIPKEGYSSPAAKPRNEWSKDSAWTSSPGPKGEIQKGIVLADEQRNELQSRVELLHKKWNITNHFMDPPKELPRALLNFAERALP
jgi:hypothetical protein